MQELFTLLSKVLEDTKQKESEIEIQDVGIDPLNLEKVEDGVVAGNCAILIKNNISPVIRGFLYIANADEVLIARNADNEILSEQNYKKAEEILYNGIHEHCTEMFNAILNSNDSINFDNEEYCEDDESVNFEDNSPEICLEKIYIHEKKKKIEIYLSVFAQNENYIDSLIMSKPYGKRPLAKQVESILKKFISEDKMFAYSKEDEIKISTSHCEVISIKSSTTTPFEKYVEEEKKMKTSATQRSSTATMPVMKTKWNEVIRNLREDHDLTQKEVAKILGISQRVYSNYECGQTDISINSIITLSKYYKVSTDYLLGLTKKKNF